MSSYSLKNFIQGASIYTVGQLLTKASAFLLLPILTYYLTPSDIGIIGYVQVIIQLFIVIFMFGFESAQTRFIHDGNKSARELGSFFYTINITILFFFIVLSIIVYLFGFNLYTLLGSEEIPYYPYIVVIFGIVLTEVFIQLLIGYYISIRNYKKTIILQFFHFLMASLLSIILIVFFDFKAEGRFFGILLSNILFILFFYKEYLNKFFKKFEKNNLKYATILGFPIMIHSLGSVLLSFSDRIILEKYTSLTELGIYTLGYQLGMIMSVIVTAINRSWQPNFFNLMNSDKSLNEKKYEFRKFIAFWFIGVSSLTYLIILFSKEMILFVFPESYSSVVFIVPLIILGYFFQGIYHILNSIIYFYKKHYLMPFLTFFLVAINIIINLILIPRIGMYGAAISTIASFMLQSIIIYLLTLKYFNHESEKNFILISVLLIIFTFFTLYLDVDIYHFFYKLIYVIISIIFSLYIYKKYVNRKIFNKRV